MLLRLLQEIEDQTTKLGGCLERGDTVQALNHHAEIRALLIEAAVAVLRHGEPGGARASQPGAGPGQRWR